MARTVVGLYDDRATAAQVVSDLEATGFGEPHLQVASTDTSSRTSYDVEGGRIGPDALTRYGIPGDEAGFYAEGVRRGGTLVVARVHDDDVDKAADIMARHNPVQYESRQAAYRETGFTDYDQSAPAYTAEQATAERGTLKEIEERLQVGKREVQHGGVRLHQVAETHREEQVVRLRDEEVRVERTNVNRPATEADLNEAFQNRTVEMVERDEEAVVSKQAVVTGEVGLGKTVTEREETVGADVRTVRVEVEQIGSETMGRQGDDFRQHYGSSFANSGQDYDYYRPAYEYGYAAGNQYRDRDYNAISGDLERDYTSRYGDRSAWDKVKDAVQHGFNRARAAV